jgi:DNA-binding NarL/FixJ family response regulator
MEIAVTTRLEQALRLLVECGCAVEPVNGALHVSPPTEVSAKTFQKIYTTVAALSPTVNGAHEKSLTPQQAEILLRLSAAKANKQIAFELGITETTVKAHVTNIYRRLGVRNRAEALLLVQRQLHFSAVA